MRSAAPTTRRALPDGESAPTIFCTYPCLSSLGVDDRARRPISKMCPLRHSFQDNSGHRRRRHPCTAPKRRSTPPTKMRSAAPNTRQAVPVDGSALLRVCRCPCLSSLGVAYLATILIVAVWPCPLRRSWKDNLGHRRLRHPCTASARQSAPPTRRVGPTKRRALPDGESVPLRSCSHECPS